MAIALYDLIYTVVLAIKVINHREDYEHIEKIWVILLGSIQIVGLIVYSVLAYKLYREFGWHVYKKIGADRQLRRKFT